MDSVCCRALRFASNSSSMRQSKRNPRRGSLFGADILWWARRPLAALSGCAIRFVGRCSVEGDDSGSRPDLFPTEEEQHAERERVFDLISDLGKWDNSNVNAAVRECQSRMTATMRTSTSCGRLSPSGWKNMNRRSGIDAAVALASGIARCRPVSHGRLPRAIATRERPLP